MIVVMDAVVGPLTVASAVGCGLMAGVFFAFSVAVMPALARLPSEQGAAAMRAVNSAIVTPLFLLLFLGTTAACGSLLVTAVFTDRPEEALRVVGAVLYVLGAFGVTVAANVPLNSTLDNTLDEDARVWERYRTRWTAWNHVRTGAATAASVALTLGA